MVVGTCALPIWRSKRIAWLPLESLCRQNKPSEGWELIVFEEKHDEAVGEAFILSYEDRLKEVGCERILYMTSDSWYPLSQKWVMISRQASETSKYFCMVASDDYYHPNHLREAENAIKEADWIFTTKGYFYDFVRDQVIMYHHNSVIGMHMIANINMVKRFPLEDVRRGVDTWTSNQMINIAHSEGRKLRYMILTTDNWKNILCTNGLNNISTGRGSFFEDIHYPFFPTEVKLEQIVPEDICSKLKELSRCLKSQ